MANIFIRTTILYLFAFIMIRAMGRRQIAQLQPFEFVLAILIADLAAMPMSNIAVPLFYGMVPILTLFLLHTLISFIAIKSEKSRALICGKPVIVIDKGRICKDSLKDLQYNLSDLLEQLRSKDVSNIADVEYAILETNGELSILKKELKQDVINEDMNIYRPYEGLPLALILDGRINESNVKAFGFDLMWLQKQLNNCNIDSAKDVLIFNLDMQGNAFIQRQDQSSKPLYITVSTPTQEELGK